MKQILFSCITVFLFLQSCIKDAPQNPEADIESFILDTTQITSAPVIDQAGKKILLFLNENAYQKGVAPILKLSQGATVSPTSGDTIHFDQQVSYTVTSQSGANKKTYTVDVVTVGNWTFNFEKWGLQPDNKYEFPLEEDGVQIWSSGNPGIALAGVNKTPSAYPTRSTTNGYLGTKAAEIVTLPGTAISEVIGVKLFSGSLFLGTFNSSQALANPLLATEFGQPYVGLPARFTGYYSYQPGNNFQDKDGNIIVGETDQCALYAILFNGPARLNGSNIQTSEKIVAKAILNDGSAKATFTRFDIPFTYTNVAPGNNLMLAIVASSSAQGASYRGAIGSKLVVDSLRIIHQ